MPASGPRRSLRNLGVLSTALATTLLATTIAYAQEPSAAPAAGASQAGAANTPSTPSSRSSAQSSSPGFLDTLIPGTEISAFVDLSETYTTNAGGTAGRAADDYLTRFSLGTNFHEHSARVSLDATYDGGINYYARNSEPIQYTNDLQAFGTVIAVPDYLTFIGRAFAQPVTTSSSGVLTANNSVAPGGFRNSYGFSAGPDLTFHLENFATSDTNASYGSAYFTAPAGTRNIPTIPGLPGPEDTVMRTLTEKLSSGPDFSRLSWTAVGLFSETSRPQSLLSEKAGIGTFRFAITHEIALLATGGYDAISNTTPLTQNVSGPVGMGGIGLTFEDLQFEFQAGQKYNSGSYLGSLRYNISPTAALTGSATDSVQTPEGQLLNSLSQLTATPNGTLTSMSDLYANGTASSLAAFSAQPMGNSAYNQTIARYQRLDLSFMEDFERYHALVSVYGMRLTQLSGFFIGPPVTNSWGANATLGHDITRLLQGSIGAGYSDNQELGGYARLMMVNGQLSYSLAPDTNAYFRTDFVHRQSSSSLAALSPLTGSLDDLRITLGLNHTL